MHLAFIDIAQSYAADRPEADMPFGGTNSAVCFLARELVKVGVACTFFNKVEEPQSAHGITSLPFQSLIDEAANPAYTAFIFCGRWVEWLVAMVREKTSAPLIAWMHESVLNTNYTPALDAFSGAVFVSEWQKSINEAFAPQHWHLAVIRNAMNPAFASLFGAEEITAAKQKPPVLIYAGATPRGVLHMPAILNALRRKGREFTAEIYCNSTPTQDAQINAAFAGPLRDIPNVTHMGMVGQGELAQRMKRASVLVMPNPWPETSCITMMEAMAAGLFVVSTNRGALPETAAGQARIIPIEDAGHATRYDMSVPTDVFAEAVGEILAKVSNQSAATESELKKNMDYFISNYQWSQRIQPWMDYVRSLLTAKP